jgi:hypothetical protein
MAWRSGRYPRLVQLLMLLAAGTVVNALVWRISSSLSGVPAWFGLSFLVIEIIGFMLSGLLLFQLWPGRSRTRVAPTPLDGPATIVILADGATEDDIHASLLGAREVRGEHTTLLVVREEVVDTFALAARLDVDYTVIDHPDRARALEAIRVEIDTPYLLVLDAGDVVMPDVLEHLGAEIVGSGNPQHLPCNDSNDATTTTTTTTTTPPAGGPLKKFRPSSNLTKAPGPTGASVLAQLPGVLGSASSKLVIGGSTLQRGATAARGSRHANVTKPSNDQRRPLQPWVPIVVAGMFGAVLVLMRLRRQNNVPLSRRPVRPSARWALDRAVK